MKPWGFFGAVLAGLFALISHLPLAWIGNIAIPKTLTPRPSFNGTIWQGYIGNIEGINPVSVRVRGADIFRGRPPISFKSVSPFLQFEGTSSLTGKVNTAAMGHIRGLSIFDARFQTLSGKYEVTLKDMIVRSQCESGEGQISTNILSENTRAWKWQGPLLSGPLSCEDGQIVARLSGADARQNISAQVNLDVSGTYRADVEVITADPQAEFVLPLFGFQKTPQGYSLSEAGRWN